MVEFEIFRFVYFQIF